MPDMNFDRIARFYDCEHEQFVQDIPFYAGYAQKCGGEVLELACGTGRILFPIAREGIKITGLDISQGMLDIARKKLAAIDEKYKSNVELVRGDMTDFDLNKQFALIYIPFRSFQGLLTKADQGKCLERARKHLAEDGVFILDLFAPLHKYLAMERRREYMGIFIDRENGLPITHWAETFWNLADQTLQSDWFYEWTDQHGRFQRQIWRLEIGYLFRYEAELLLEKYGFKVNDVFGGFKKEPYNYYSGEQIFVCKKA
jgi:SAM-dependent methyltransferase